MRKAIGSILLTVMLAVQLSGCGAEELEASGASDAVQDISGADSQEISPGAGGILDPSAVLSLEGKDNSLDAYFAAVRVPLRVEKPEKALGGGGTKSFLGATGAYYFKKHLFSTAAESWDELLFVTGEGKASSEHFEWKNQIWDLGLVVGTDHYVVLDFEEQEGEDYRYFLTERDENHENQREFPLDFLTGSVSDIIMRLSDFAVDQSGTVNLVQSTEEGKQYLLVSQEGEILTEYIFKGSNISRLTPLYDGRIAFGVSAKGDSGGMTLQYMDWQTDGPVTLATLEKEAFCLTLLDEDTLLYADREGVYRSGLSGQNPELLYRWSNHGIIAHGVSAMQVDEEGRIALIYNDSENGNYLCLEPTTEEVALCAITMEVPDTSIHSYEWVVAEFNKRYPSCHIELVEYNNEDRTALLTQLTAGKGPVLLDPGILSFEDLEELWEPLDIVMEQQGIMEELLPTALEMGKINGTLYGIVRDFNLGIVVANPDLKDWDYDTFFQCVQDKPEMDAISDYYDRESGIYYLIDLLNHGLDDNYFIVPDEKTGAMQFDSGRFRQILDLTEKYYNREEGVVPGTSFLEGNVLCNRLTIRKPEDVAAYRTIYGEDVNYIGYPTKDGGTHFMSPANMLAIRRSATKEEKEVAAAFLGLYLSYEAQVQAEKEINFDLSVRKDVLEEQIASMESATNMPYFGAVSMRGNMDKELDRTTLLDMIDKAKPDKALPEELWEIISGELDQYWAGIITKDMLIDHLENRVGLYLGEKN